MSRIGKQPIVLPEGVTVSIETGHIVVHGPKGVLTVPVHALAAVSEADGVLTVTVKHPEAKSDRSIWGLTTRLIANAVQGVHVGFSKQLEVHGVGFRVALNGNVLDFVLGYSHPVVFALPDGITATVEKNVITVSGIDKQLVGEVAAKMRSLRKPDAYHGKGVRYAGEELKLKPGKSMKGAGS
ncbi:MAG: 50S ribosomal protein L6 [Candidatus Uhrbacteria bacterium]